MERKICIITGTRADWGLLSGIAKELKSRPGVKLQIVATNMHLSPKFGNTRDEIERDGLSIDYCVPMPVENDTAARHELFIAEWRKQCSEKKAQAKGWRQWLTEEMQWSVPEGNFWDDEKLQRRLSMKVFVMP